MKPLLERKIIGGFFFGLIIILSLGFLAYTSITGLVRDNRSVMHSHEVLTEISETGSLLKDGNRSLRGYGVTGDTTFLKPFFRFKENIYPQLDKVHNLVGDNKAQQQLVDTLRLLTDEAMAFFARGTNTKSMYEQKRIAEIIRSGKGNRIMESVQSTIERFEQAENAILQQRIRISEASTKRTLVIILATSLVGLGLALFAIITLRRNFNEQRQATTQLLERKKRFRAIFENSGVGIILAALDSRILQGNATFEKITGLTSEEIPLKNFKDLAHPDDLVTLENLLERLLKSEADCLETEVRFFKKDNSLIWVKLSISLVSDAKDKPEYFVCVTEDITSQKAFVVQLQQQDELLHGSADALNILLSDGDFDERVQKALSRIGLASKSDRTHIFEDRINDEGEPTLQMKFSWSYDGKDILKTSPAARETTFAEYGLTHWYTKIAAGEMIIAHVDELPEKEKSSFEMPGYKSILIIPVILKDKLWGHIGFGTLHSKQVWSDAEKSILKSVAISFARAIEREEGEQELIRFNADLIKARREAEQANRARSAFLASMSHELRTPLNAILGFSQILQKDTILPVKHRSYVDIILKSGSTLLETINDILDISKIESERMELLPEDFALQEMVTDLYNKFYTRAYEKGIILNINYSDELPALVFADLKRLRQVLINLLSNAVKYTAKGSVMLNIDVEERYEDADGGDSFIIGFEVRDTGRGIADSQLKRIFEPFRQISDTYSDGTGLGLAISSRIIALMGGALKVESTVGVGSIFSFTIRVKVLDKKVKSPNTTPSEIFAGIQGDREWKVLIVDDVESNRRSVCTFLEKIGFVCAEASEGETALLLAKQFEPDVIIMDLVMSIMDGQEAITALRNTNYGRELPVIALTASGSMITREYLLKMGFSEYISKPFDKGELLATIARLTSVEYDYGNSRDKSASAAEDAIHDSLYKAVRIIETLPEKLQQSLIDAIEVQEFDEIQRLIQLIEKEHSVTKELKVLLKAAQAAHFKVIADVAELLRDGRAN